MFLRIIKYDQMSRGLNIPRSNSSGIFLLDYVKLLFCYEVATDQVARFDDELLPKGSHFLTCHVDGEILKIWQSFYLYTVSTYEELVPDDERSRHPYGNSISTVSSALEFLDDMN